jgi:pimeloyl-ACP methyl ester carboxylesterase
MRLIAVLLATLTPLGAEEPTVERWQVDGRPALLRVPAKAAAGRPWLWVAEFQGHLGGFESAMLREGWHVAHVACPNQFGSARAMRTWEALHKDLTTRRGLASRPAVLGISRGGLYALAWARLHPDKVSAIYLDNAVCDGRSWPGGKPLGLGQGKGSPRDWQLQRAEFGFADDAAAIAGLPRPSDGLERARDLGVRLISVHGTADSVVPHAENAVKVLAFWEAGGREPIVFAKEGGDHHPHGLKDMAPVVAAVIGEGRR